jgi:hypothetical protein
MASATRPLARYFRSPIASPPNRHNLLASASPCAESSYESSYERKIFRRREEVRRSRNPEDCLLLSRSRARGSSLLFLLLLVLLPLVFVNRRRFLSVSLISDPDRSRARVLSFPGTFGFLPSHPPPPPPRCNLCASARAARGGGVPEIF